MDKCNSVYISKIEERISSLENSFVDFTKDYFELNEDTYKVEVPLEVDKNILCYLRFEIVNDKFGMFIDEDLIEEIGVEIGKIVKRRNTFIEKVKKYFKSIF